MSDIDTASAAFIAAATKMGYSAEQTAAGLSSIAQRMGATSNQLGKLAANIESAAAGSRAQGAASRQAGLELNKVISSARAAARSQEEFRDSANRAANAMVDSVSDPRLKASIRRYADAQIDAAERAETFRNVMSMASKPMANLSSAAGGVFQAYKAGESGIGTSAALLEGAFKVTGGLMQQFGGVISTLAGVAAAGSIFAPLQAKIALLAGSAGLGIIGKLMEGFGTALQKTADVVLPKLQALIEQNIASFVTMSRSGAIFAGGLDDMSDVAANGMMTLAQLSKVVESNKEVFAGMGENVQQGLTRVTNVIRVGGEDLRKRLLGLGFSVEEQAGVIAEVSRAMSQGKKLPQTADTDRMIAQETQKYAENLRIIASITGEDAKKKEAEAKQQAAKLAFQQKIDSLGPAQKLAAEKFMMSMSAREQQQYMEYVVNNGQALTQATALNEQFLPANAEMLKGLAAKVNDGTAQLGDEFDARARYQARTEQEGISANRNIGLIGMGAGGGNNPMVQELSQSIGETIQNNRRSTAEAIEDARRNARNVQTPQQGTIQREMIEGINANQKLNLAIDSVTRRYGMMTTYLDLAATATTAFLTGLDLVTERIEEMRRESVAERRVPVPAELPEPRRGSLRTPEEQARAREARRAAIDAANAENARLTAEENARLATQAAGEENQRNRLQRQQERATAPGAPNANEPPIDYRRPQPAVQPNTGPRADIGTAAGQLQAGTDYFRSGLTVQPVNPNGTPLPPNPDANETPQQRQARIEQQAMLGMTPEQIERARTTLDTNRQAPAPPAQETPTQRTLQRLATTMDSVNDAITQSLEKLASIESNTRRTATNTG